MRVNSIIRATLSPMIRNSVSAVSIRPAISQLPSRFSSTMAAQQENHTETVSKEEAARIRRIVDDISELSLRETSMLIKELKIALNISDIAMAPAAHAAPVSAQAQQEAAAPAAPVEEKKEKKEFTVKLEKFDAASKAKVIREIKTLTGMSLVDAKKFVESAANAAQTIKDNVPKEDAEKMKKVLEENGATVSLS